jgi:hypothetical protein
VHGVGYLPLPGEVGDDFSGDFFPGKGLLNGHCIFFHGLAEDGGRWGVGEHGLTRWDGYLLAPACRWTKWEGVVAAGRRIFPAGAACSRRRQS